MKRLSGPRAAFAAVAISLGVGVPLAWAGGGSPVGRWKTIDDDTGEAKAVVRIWKDGGELKGKIEKLFPKPGADPAPTCTECDGPRKDKPIIGMTIVWGLEEDDGEWSGGRILDPKSGTAYKCKLHLASGGTRLKVRGYVGFSLVGRTQIWHRKE